MIAQKEALHIYIVNLAVWSGDDQLGQSVWHATKKGLDHTLECLRGSGGFIDDICSRLKGHRRYKYIWKSLSPQRGLFIHDSGCPGLCVPFYHILAPSLHFDSLHMSSDSRPLRFIRVRFMFLEASSRFLVAALTAGSVFLPAHSY